MTDCEPSPFNFVDFAVLELHQAVDKSIDSFLRFPAEATVPNPWLANGQCVCYVGIPQPIYESPSDFLRLSVDYFIAKTRPDEADDFMKSLIWNSMFDFDGPVVSYGYRIP